MEKSNLLKLYEISVIKNVANRRPPGSPMSYHPDGPTFERFEALRQRLGVSKQTLIDTLVVDGLDAFDKLQGK